MASTGSGLLGELSNTWMHAPCIPTAKFSLRQIVLLPQRTGALRVGWSDICLPACMQHRPQCQLAPGNDPACMLNRRMSALSTTTANSSHAGPCLLDEPVHKGRLASDLQACMHARSTTLDFLQPRRPMKTLLTMLTMITLILLAC